MADFGTLQPDRADQARLGFRASQYCRRLGQAGQREFRRYLDIALGSLAEVSYLLRLARDLSLLSEAAWVEAEGARDAAARVTWLLYRSMAS
ncbi:MAG TPA: four helix bundle protein [Gemmatimonadales bacterium]|nr:four helix bundle protein [Gemmatimonadales bacterium]